MASGVISLARPRGSVPAPTVGYIEALRQEADHQAGPARKRWAEIAEVRARQHVISIPEEYKTTTKEVRTHFVGEILKTIKASLTVNFPTFTVPPQGPGPAQQQNSTLREKWSSSLLQQLDSERLPKRVWPRLMDHAVSYGLAIAKAVYTPHTWHDYPSSRAVFGVAAKDLDDASYQKLVSRQEEYKQGRVPFAWQAVDPRTWWASYGEGGLKECIEVSERTLGQLTSRYAVRWDGQKIQTETVSEPYAIGYGPESTQVTRTFVEHWTDTYVTYTCDGVILQQWKHGYGRVPYFPFYGLSNETAKPGCEMESVVEHIVDIVKLYDNLLTMWQNWAYLAAFPSSQVVGQPGVPPLVLGPESEGEQQMGPPTIAMTPGRATVFPPGFERKYDVPPPVGRDLMLVSDVLRQFIERTLPDVLRGVGKSDQAGYAINQLITAARLVYDPITDNASLALGQMMRFFWWLVEHKVRERVYVWGEGGTKAEGSKWLGLGPTDIKGYYVVTCNIEALLPTNLIAEGQFGLDQALKGAISMQTHRERFMRIPNPEEMADQIRVERFLDDPQSPLYQEIQRRALKEAGLLDDLEAQQRAAALAEVPLPPGVNERMAMDQAAAGGGPGMPVQPGLGMPLTPGTPGAPGAAFGPGDMGGGMPGGRAAGMPIQPNTQMLPGGLPENS